MNLISKEDVLKAAFLSRLYKAGTISSQELEKYTADLESILIHSSELNSLSDQGIDFHAGSRIITVQQLRSDTPTNNVEQYQRIRANIIKNFPLCIDNQCAIEGIFNTD